VIGGVFGRDWGVFGCVWGSLRLCLGQFEVVFGCVVALIGVYDRKPKMGKQKEVITKKSQTDNKNNLLVL
jgi:hypothetical protein